MKTSTGNSKMSTEDRSDLSTPTKSSTEKPPSLDSEIITVNAFMADIENLDNSYVQKDPVSIAYILGKFLGKGSFGSVYKILLCDTNHPAALKSVIHSQKFKNRELHVMKQIKHKNIVDFYYFFYTSDDTTNDLYLNLIIEYVPSSLSDEMKKYSSKNEIIPNLYTKMYTYQLFLSLDYLHSKGICHRDIKPHNLLVYPNRGILKLCDFGSAKFILKHESSVSYICSRYYRAPELLFGSTNYSLQIDVWSGGCVLAEMLIGSPIFIAENGVNQLVEIIKILGSPTEREISNMNPIFCKYTFPTIKHKLFPKVFKNPKIPKSAIQLVELLLTYTPNNRLSPKQVCNFHFFDNMTK
ncbi:hypothetical protein A3Q56_05995 [Intoshia linei]|uniref:Protein kinase domain-containing protein n=1 Tax=Intoshia linei TaxID=1819745 RepID=A0A177AXQ8_9BILA|nr:hypothetical protein A3Q56_05995 [Intoshia linei]